MWRKIRLPIWLTCCTAILFLAACAIPQPPTDPSVANARASCADLSEPERYACIEQIAVADQNPEICWLAGIAIDDMCLQVVYESVDAPFICERLYLPGARANCQTYFADPNHRPSLIGSADSAQWSEPDAEPGIVAYVLDGDIWIKALPDGEPQRITDDGVNEEPRWSSSGRWLAFRKLDSQVWLYSLAENQSHAIENGAPVNAFAWSPVEDRLAALIGSGIVHLQVITPGAEAGLMLEPPAAESMPGNPFWDPSGQWIAYTWQGTDAAGEPRQTIRMRPAAGGDPITLLKGGNPVTEVTLNIAGWQPHGDQLLFWYGPRLIDSFLSDTMDLRALPVDQQPFSGEPPIYTADVSWWFADDFAAAPPDTGLGLQNAVATTIGAGPFWTQKAIAIADHRLTPADQVAIQPAWSPDGLRIAYSGMPEPGPIDIDNAAAALSERRIWMVDVLGGADPQPWTTAPAFRDEHPQWSDDGRFILYARLDADGRASLWLLSPDTGDSDRVVEHISIPETSDPALQTVLWHRSYDWLPRHADR